MDSVLYSEDESAIIAFAQVDLPGTLPDSPSVAVSDSTSSVPDTLQLPTPTPIPPLRQPFIAIPIVSGAVGGFAIGYGAAIAGALIADQADDGEDLDALGGALIGITIGEPLGVALGTHIGNGSRGSFGTVFAMSFLSGLAGAYAAAALEGAGGVVIGSAIQLGITTWAERRSALVKYDKRVAASAR